MPIYLLTSPQTVLIRWNGPDGPYMWSGQLFMMGTAPQIKERREYMLLERYKRGQNRACRKQNREEPAPDFLPNPIVAGVIPGNENDAGWLYRELLRHATVLHVPLLKIERENWPDHPFHLFTWTDLFLEWCSDKALDWDGFTDAETLGVKPLVEFKETTTAAVPVLTEKEVRRDMPRDPTSKGHGLFRRMLTSFTPIRVRGLGSTWNGPTPVGQLCPVCQGRPGERAYCVACDKSGFTIAPEKAAK